MQAKEMEQKLNEFEEYKKTFEAQFKHFLKDESIPLHIRWDIFCKSELGEIEHYVPSLPELRKLIERWDLDRREERDIMDIVEDMLEYDDDGNITGIQEHTVADIIIKYALDNYYKGFRYDW